MKKKHIVGLIFLCCQLPLFAQVFVGIRGGAYINDYRVVASNKSTNVSRDPIMGWSVGVPINVKLNNTFSLQPEFNYSHIGVFLQGSSGYYTETRKTSLNYLEIPLLCRIALGGKKLRFFSLLGPHFSYLLNGKDSYNKKYAPFNAPIQVSGYNFIEGSEKRLQRTDAGMQIGTGFSFKVGGGYLSLDTRWIGGFMAVNKTSVGFHIYNSGFMFGAAYIFKVIRKKE